MAPRVTIDPELCIGSGECVRLVPAAFRLDDGLGVAVPIPGVDTVPRELLAEAAAGCPTGAIGVTDQEEER